jgi:adenosine/AMP kinase
MLIKNIYKLLFVFIVVIIFPAEASYKITVHDSSKAYQGTTIFADTSSSPHKIVEQLQRLDDLLSVIDHEAVTDSDLERIEGSTNQLMRELGVLFSHQDLGALYDVSFH